MGTRDLKQSTEKIKQMPSAVMDRARPAPSRTGPLWFIGGLVGGLAALFFFDSRRGAARRQMVVDKVMARSNDVIEMSGKKARHLRNRAKGVMADKEPDVADELADTGTQL
jgi:hypothetical protein